MGLIFMTLLKKYDIITSVIHTPEDYQELTYNYLKECALENVIYVEAMISSTHAKLERNDLYHSFLDGIVEWGQSKLRKNFKLYQNIL